MQATIGCDDVSVKDLHPALFAFLVADAAIAAAVPAGSGQYHVYPNKLPQGEKPAKSIVYQEISQLGDHHNEGASGLARSRLQITGWGTSPANAREVALLVKARLDGYRGAMGSGGSAVSVKGVFFQDQRDLYDDDLKLDGKQADYFIWYWER
jgi:hypothetical protein